MDINKLEEQLKQISPRLSRQEADILFSRIDARLSPRERGVEHKAPRRAHRARAIVSGLVILGLLGGSVVTAYASEALPGDTLYGAKITLEKARIALATSGKKPTLQVAFAERRVEEIQKVLADVEEEVSPSDPTLPMAMTAPVAEGMEEGVAPETVSLGMAMMMSAPESEGGAPQREDARMVEESVEPMSAKMGMPEETPQPKEHSDDVTTSSPEIMKAIVPKKWKNLEKKKKALEVAIKELEQTRDVLRGSGKEEASRRVEALIENLSALNTGEATPDEGFVEKIKNGEMRIEDKEYSGNEKKEGERELSETPELESRDIQSSQEAAVILSETISPEEQAEMDEVKRRNAERLRKLEEESAANAFREEERISPRPTNRRTTVCIGEGESARELSVLTRNLPSYLSKGFFPGPCPKPQPFSGNLLPKASTTPPVFHSSLSASSSTPSSIESVIEVDATTSPGISTSTVIVMDTSLASTTSEVSVSTTTDTETHEEDEE